LADSAKAAVGFGTRRMLARQKPEKRKCRKRLATSECFDKPAQSVAILDVRMHIFRSGSCAFVYSKQLPLGKNKSVKLLRQRQGRYQRATRLKSAERTGSRAFCHRTMATKTSLPVSGTGVVSDASRQNFRPYQKAATDSRLPKVQVDRQITNSPH
jgi:hypothetical protein